KQAAPDVLAEDAAVLVGLVEMFTYVARQVVLAAMGPDAHDALAAMRLFAVLEQDVDSVFGNPCQILAFESWQARKRGVEVLTGFCHATCRPSHCNCVPKSSPSIGTV